MSSTNEEQPSKVHSVRPGGTLSSLLVHPTDLHSRASGMEARLPHNQIHPLKATPLHPEPHFPGNVELQQGTFLQPDINEQHGHPGFACDQLPPHTHPLPGYDTKRKERESERREPTTPPTTPLNDLAAAPVPAQEAKVEVIAAAVVTDES